MVLALVILLIVTFIATYWARLLAIHRRRHVRAWMIATVILPPVVLILWALPPRAVSAH